jgi:ribosomal protein L7/L12
MPACAFCNHSISAKSMKCPKCGAALFEDQAAPAVGRASSATDGDVVSMLEQGRKGDAVRMYREQTGAGMREAIAAVDLLERGENAPAARSNAASANIDADLKSDLWALLQSGQKIAAVRLYRARTGGTLRTARETVEAVAREHGIVPQRSGCFGVLLLCLVLPGLLIGMIVAGR